MVDRVKRRKNENDGFLVSYQGIAVPCRNNRVCRVVSILIMENLYDAAWVADVLNKYGARVKHHADLGRAQRKRSKR